MFASHANYLVYAVSQNATGQAVYSGQNESIMRGSVDNTNEGNVANEYTANERNSKRIAALCFHDVNLLEQRLRIHLM